MEAERAMKITWRGHSCSEVESKSFGFDVPGTLDDFTEQCEAVVEYPGDCLELTKDTRPHVAILKLPDEG